MRACRDCQREFEFEDMVQMGMSLVCEPCADVAVKAEQRRDSIDDALAVVRSVRRGGHVHIQIQLGYGRSMPWIQAEYRRDGDRVPAAEIRAEGHIARELRGFAAVIDNLPPLPPPEGPDR